MAGERIGRIGQALIGIGMSVGAIYGGSHVLGTSSEISQKVKARAAQVDDIVKTPNPSDKDYGEALEFVDEHSFPQPISEDTHKGSFNTDQRQLNPDDLTSLANAKIIIIRRGAYENIPDPVNTRPMGLMVIVMVSSMAGSIGPVVMRNAFRPTQEIPMEEHPAWMIIRSLDA